MSIHISSNWAPNLSAPEVKLSFCCWPWMSHGVVIPERKASWVFFFLLFLIISCSSWLHTSKQNLGFLFSNCLLKESERIIKKKEWVYSDNRSQHTFASGHVPSVKARGEGVHPARAAPRPAGTFLIFPATASLRFPFSLQLYLYQLLKNRSQILNSFILV